MLTVKKRSPHLHSVIQRTFKGDGVAHELIERCFSHAVECGGLQELDFVREEGVSFNPRPARVALILLNNAQVNDAEIVAAGILASSSPLDELKRLDVSERSRVLAHAAMGTPAEVIAIEPVIRFDVAVVALSLWLDRIRHLHQAADSEALGRWEEMLAETDRYIELAALTSAELHTLLIAWRERAAGGRERQRSLLVEGSRSE